MSPPQPQWNGPWYLPRTPQASHQPHRVQATGGGNRHGAPQRPFNFPQPPFISAVGATGGTGGEPPNRPPHRFVPLRTATPTDSDSSDSTASTISTISGRIPSPIPYVPHFNPAVPPPFFDPNVPFYNPQVPPPVFNPLLPPPFIHAHVPFNVPPPAPFNPVLPPNWEQNVPLSAGVAGEFGRPRPLRLSPIVDYFGPRRTPSPSWPSAPSPYPSSPPRGY